MTIYVLTENQPSEGGEPIGFYSGLEKAEAAAADNPPAPDWFYYLIHPFELDAAPQRHSDSISPKR